jgi:aminoglycoside 6'-N-acetyltransferase
VLWGDKVRLKFADDSDIDDLYTWWNDRGFYGEYSRFDPKTRSEIEAMVKRKEGRLFIIVSLLGDKTIGFIDYSLPRSTRPNLFEIGYRIKPEERRKGYTTDAARLVVDYLFTTNKETERIEALTEAGNIASQRVLEKNGFKREGEMRKRALNNGQCRDEYMYGLLREEWRSDDISRVAPPESLSGQSP